MGSMGIGKPSPLQRRNSIATTVVPAELDIPTEDLNRQTVALDLATERRLSYTSLKDLIPSFSRSFIQSSPGGSNQSCHEISIRNRLVKQAAWAYLQPVAPSPAPSGSHFFHGVCSRFLPNCLAFFRRHLMPIFSRALDCLRWSLCIRWKHRER